MSTDTKAPARIWLDREGMAWRPKADSVWADDMHAVYVREDLVRPLVEALREAPDPFAERKDGGFDHTDPGVWLRRYNDWRKETLAALADFDALNGGTDEHHN